MKSLHIANQNNALPFSPAAVLVITCSNAPCDVSSIKELSEALVIAPIKNGELIAEFLKGVFGPATLNAIKEHL